MMLATTFLLAALVSQNPVAENPDDRKVRQAIERSVVYLQEEAVEWIHTYKCASCHHGAMGLWSLNEAAARGIKVDKAAVDELTAWILENPVRSKLLPDPKAAPTPVEGEIVSLPSVYGLLAARSVPPKQQSPAI